MLIDKSYYDYDFNEEALEKAKNRKKVDKKTREAAWKRMGFGTMQNATKRVESKPLDVSGLQRIAMKELTSGGA